jgi:hypothetical protein
MILPSIRCSITCAHHPVVRAIELPASAVLREMARHFFDDYIAWIGHGIDRVSEADDHFFLFDARTNVFVGFIRRFVALLNLERDFVRSAVLRSAQCADGAGEARIHVRAGAGDYTRGERGGVEFMLGVENKRGVHRANPIRRRRTAMQQVQEVRRDRVVVGFHVNALTGMRVVIPVRQHRT